MPTWLIIVLVVGLVVVLGCCGGVSMCAWGARRVARRVQVQRLTLTSRPVAVERPGVGAIPGNFPEDVPVMPGFTATGPAMAIDAQGNGMAMFTGTTGRADVVAYYQKQMKDNGWSELRSAAVGPSTTMIYVKGTRQTTIQVVDANANVLLTIQYGPKP